MIIEFGLNDQELKEFEKCVEQSSILCEGGSEGDMG